MRINPYEVHIKDPDFCVDAFSSSKKLDKYGWWYRVFGGPGSTISTEHHFVHKVRRSAFQNFLSRRAIKEFAPTIAEKLRGIDGVMSRYVLAGEPVNLSSMYRCLAADVVSAFVLPQSLNLIQSDDLGDQFSSSLRFFFEAVTVGRYLEFVEVVIKFIPSAVVRGMLSQPARQLLGLVRVSHSSR